VGTVDAIAEAIVFVVSDHAAFFNSQSTVIDGGYLTRRFILIWNSPYPDRYLSEAGSNLYSSPQCIVRATNNRCSTY